MLAQLRRMTERIARRLAELHRKADQLHCAHRGMLIVDDIVVGQHLRIVGQVGDAVHEGIDEVSAGFERLHPLLARPSDEDLVEDRDRELAGC